MMETPFEEGYRACAETNADREEYHNPYLHQGTPYDAMQFDLGYDTKREELAEAQHCARVDAQIDGWLDRSDRC